MHGGREGGRERVACDKYVFSKNDWGYIPLMEWVLQTIELFYKYINTAQR